MNERDEIKVLIWSAEHAAFWRPNETGYTPHQEDAGIYPIERASEICRDANKHSALPAEMMVPL